MTTAQAPRRVRNGEPTNDLVLSAYVGSNHDLFPQILALYVAPKSTVADVTYGKGVFWRNVPEDRYDLRATDIQDGVDCRDLPYDDEEIDCVVLDPPYMHSPGGTAHSSHSAFERHYRNNGTGNRTERKYHDAVLALYEEAGEEAYRVLKDRGVMIVKCQDEVCSNRQRFTHVEIMEAYEALGFVAEDLFVVVRQNRPGVSRTVQQVHARKNHSYFLVFWKRSAGRAAWKPPA
ncbi:DNA methyltransferase [Candidatus Palauibacter sp.]|uniref:DNA methyltransferase n=1 Tax=Candidatus Palauibacter sp. TaxID=3101350 RepID=UPI003CC562B3